MINNEIYWTEEYVLYAEMIEKRELEKAKLDIEQNLQVPQEEEKENSEC